MKNLSGAISWLTFFSTQAAQLTQAKPRDLMPNSPIIELIDCIYSKSRGFGFFAVQPRVQGAACGGQAQSMSWR